MQGRTPAETAIEAPQIWHTARGRFAIDKPIVVGIVNITPDSFSDGGRFLAPSDAVAHATALVAAGADMIDVGAESTRPGRPCAVPEEEEWKRLRPFLKEFTRSYPAVPVSVDTVKSTIAQKAMDAGAWAINDVATLRIDPRIAEVVAKYRAGLILSHSRGPFQEMAGYEHAQYDDVTKEVATELMTAVAAAQQLGVSREQIVLDPGLGFSKTPEQNIELIRGLRGIVSLGMPVMVGPSRKRFLGVITGKDVGDRDNATAAACIAALLGGAYLFRVHDVATVKESLIVADALRSI